MMKSTILTITVNPALDLSSRISGLVPEKKLRCSNPVYFPGGGGINVSRALARLGAQAPAMYAAGGPSGERIGQLLAEEKIPTLPIEVEPWTRENLTVLDEASGSQYRFTFPGLPLPEAGVVEILRSIEGLNPFPEYLVLSGSFAPGFPIDFMEQLKAVCLRHHARLVVDTSGPYLKAAAKAGVFLMKPNYQELCDLAGIQGGDLHDVREIGRKLIAETGVEILVVSLGANGATLVTKDEYIHIHAPRVPVKSTVGAGDSMLAGVVFALSSGKALKDVMKWGVACGTATTMNEGTGLFRTGQPEQVLNLIG